MYVISGEIGDKPTGMARGLGQTIDLSTWTWEDWVLVGVGGIVLFSLLNKGKAKASAALRRRKSKVSKGTFLSGPGTFGDIALLALVAGGAWVGYNYLIAGQSSGS